MTDDSPKKALKQGAIEQFQQWIDSKFTDYIAWNTPGIRHILLMWYGEDSETYCQMGTNPEIPLITAKEARAMLPEPDRYCVEKDRGSFRIVDLATHPCNDHICHCGNLNSPRRRHPNAPGYSSRDAMEYNSFPEETSKCERTRNQ